MEVRVIQGDITDLEVDAAVVNLFEGVTTPGGATGAMDQALGGAISDLIADGAIKGTVGQMTPIHTLGRIRPKRALVVGLGKPEAFSLDTVRRVSAEMCRFLRGLGVERVASITHGAGIGGLEPRAAAQAVVEGALLGLYSFHEYREESQEERKELEELLLVEQDNSKTAALQQGVETGRILAEATALARDLVNTPADEMTPTHLAEVAGGVARAHGLEVKILERPQCQELGMGAFLSVAQGSSQPPKFIVLTYVGDPDHPENNLGLIGKGVTFDSGGISLKPAAGMGAMKGDMTDGASVIAAMQAIGQLRPALNVTAIVATLTGAVRVALGQVRMGLFTNDQPLADRVLRAGEATGEKMWQLPMDDEYKEQNRSDVADLKNTGGQAAGSITAALFVGEFAGETPWVHLDIAAVNMTDKERGPFVKGATGIPVRSLVRLAQELAGDAV